MPAQFLIDFKGVDCSPALEQSIERHVRDLEHLHRGLTSCRATIGEAGRHQRQGREFEVRLDLKIKGHEYAITRKHDEDPFVAVRDAFDAAKRVLQDEIRRVRGAVKQHAPTLTGRVARLNAAQGFGFIAADDGREWYFGRANVAHPSFDDLQPGQPVSFIEDLDGDSPQARRICVQRGAGG